MDLSEASLVYIVSAGPAKVHSETLSQEKYQVLLKENKNKEEEHYRLEALILTMVKLPKQTCQVKAILSK